MTGRRVPPAGPRNAQIAIVGEAPGREEEKEGEPFVGSSGRFLNSILTEIGLSRSQIYLTNVMKSRPSDFSRLYEDSKNLKPTEVLRGAWEELKKELAQVKPNLIVTLGRHSTYALTDKPQIEKYRGFVRETDLGKVLPSLHPAHILRGQYHKWPILYLDLKKAQREMTSPELNYPKPKIELEPHFSRVIEFLRSRPSKVAFDIETTGELVRCLGIADSPNHAIVIPFIQTWRSSSGGTLIQFTKEPGAGNYWSEEQERQLWKELKAFFADQSVRKIAQNYPFDSTLMETNFGIEVQGFELDTMLAHHTCYPELPKSLDFMTSMYTDHPHYSDYDASVDRSVWFYNGMDCVVTREVTDYLENELSDLGLSDFHYSHIQPTMLATTRMQNRGVRVDQVELSLAGEKAQEELNEAYERVGQIAGEEINPNSTPQVQNLLYKQLGLPEQRDPRTGRPTTGENALKTLKHKFPASSELIDEILRYRQRQTFISTFVNAKLTGDGRARTSYNVAGTVTGRLASSSTPFGYGMNLQNIPRGQFRRAFCADKGHKLLKVDLSQAEFRIVVWAARIERLINEFVKDPEGFDCHSYNATQVFDIDISEVKKIANKRGDTYRDLAKNGVYGSNYAMRADKASKVYDLPLEDAKFVISRYHRVYPEVSQIYWKEIEEQLQATKTITNPLGRTRKFFGRLDNDLFREAYSHFCQSTVADIINRAVRVLDTILPSGNYPLLQVHDEITFQLMDNPGNIQRCGRLIKKVMEYPIWFPGISEPLIIPAELKIGPNWNDVEPLELEKA